MSMSEVCWASEHFWLGNIFKVQRTYTYTSLNNKWSTANKENPLCVCFLRERWKIYHNLLLKNMNETNWTQKIISHTREIISYFYLFIANNWHIIPAYNQISQFAITSSSYHPRLILICYWEDAICVVSLLLTYIQHEQFASNWTDFVF